MFEKFGVLLSVIFARLLDVQISLQLAWLQWIEKGRPMDIQYGTWTDGTSEDVLWTSLGRAMSIGVIKNTLVLIGILETPQQQNTICSELSVKKLSLKLIKIYN